MFPRNLKYTGYISALFLQPDLTGLSQSGTVWIRVQHEEVESELGPVKPGYQNIRLWARQIANFRHVYSDICEKRRKEGLGQPVICVLLCFRTFGPQIRYPKCL